MTLWLLDELFQLVCLDTCPWQAVGTCMFCWDHAIFNLESGHIQVCLARLYSMGLSSVHKHAPCCWDAGSYKSAEYGSIASPRQAWLHLVGRSQMAMHADHCMLACARTPQTVAAQPQGLQLRPVVGSTPLLWHAQSRGLTAQDFIIPK